MTSPLLTEKLLVGDSGDNNTLDCLRGKDFVLWLVDGKWELWNLSENISYRSPGSLAEKVRDAIEWREAQMKPRKP